MKVLITGAGGFVGRHLTTELIASGMDVVLTSDRAGSISAPNGQTLDIHECNISDRDAFGSLMRETLPDAVVHLAAVSHVVNAQNAREALSTVNIVGTHNVCAAAASLEKPVKFLFVSTSLVYGAASSSSTDMEQAFNEDSPPAPESAYGTSKLAGEYVVRSYAGENFTPYIVRPFNHIGPGQNPAFVCAGLAQKIAAATSGGKISVGNLKTFRDFTDVRDVVRAYRLILEKSPTANLFVIGSGRPLLIEDVLNSFIEISGKRINPEVDATLLRDIDPPKLYADPARARDVLGWKPKISFEQTLKDIYQEASTRQSN